MWAFFGSNIALRNQQSKVRSSLDREWSDHGRWVSNMHCRGTGILAIWHDIEPSGYADFLEWHTREHMPERVSVPGFLRGCRYTALQGSPQYFNFYQTETPETLVSEPYLERLNNPTPWTQRVVPFFRNLNRSAGRVLGSLGIGEGGVIATLRLSTHSTRRDGLESWLVKEGLVELAELPGVVAAHFWSADPAASLVKTAESQGRVDPATFSNWTIAIEGNGEEYVVAAHDVLRKKDLFASAVENVEFGVYQMQHRLNVSG